MEADAAVRMLRLAAIDRLVGRDVGSDRLIQLGLDALLAGVDAPSLPLLAGLGRSEEPDANELFDRMVAELGLVPADLPVTHVARAWALILWWAQLIVDGTLEVGVGGNLIYWYGWSVLDDAESRPLQPLIASIVQYDDEVSSRAAWDTEYPAKVGNVSANVVAQAGALVEWHRSGDHASRGGRPDG